MTIDDEEMKPYNDQVVGFSGKRVDSRGYIELYATFGKGDDRMTIKTDPLDENLLENENPLEEKLSRSAENIQSLWPT